MATTELTLMATPGKPHTFADKQSNLGAGRIEFTIPNVRLEFTVPEDRLEFTFPKTQGDFTTD